MTIVSLAMRHSPYDISADYSRTHTKKAEAFSPGNLSINISSTEHHQKDKYELLIYLFTTQDYLT